MRCNRIFILNDEIFYSIIMGKTFLKDISQGIHLLSDVVGVHSALFCITARNESYM